MSFEDVLSGMAGLSGIQRILTGPAYRQRIRQTIQVLLDKDYFPGHLRLTRAKYKPGRKVNAYFTFPIYHRSLKTVTTRPIAVTWKTEMRDGSGIDDLIQGQEEVIRHGLAAPFSNLWSQSGGGEACMDILVSPLDPAFAQLARLSDPIFVQTRLRQIGAIDRNQGVEYRVTPIRYRPGERHVLRYSSDQQPGASILYTKLYKTGEAAARAARVATRITDWLDNHAGPLKGAYPYAVLDADAAILYPKISGTPLSRLLPRASRDLGVLLREVGKGLRGLHDGPVELTADLSANPIEKEIRAIARASEHLLVLLPEGYSRIQEILERAATALSSIAPEPPTFTHSDFKSDHLLVRRDSLTLIDFDTCALADPALDIGKFLADLDYWFAIYGISGVDEVQSAFVEGYAAGGLEDRVLRSKVYHALILIKITVRRIRLFDRNWTTLTMQLLQKAETILHEVEISQTPGFVPMPDHPRRSP